MSLFKQSETVLAPSYGKGLDLRVDIYPTSVYYVYTDELKDYMTKLSNRFKLMAEVYLYFARDYIDYLDFTDEMLVELYTYESTGKGNLSADNGYAMGKRNIDIAVASWIEDLNNGMLFLHELYEDNNYPHWFLDKVLSQFQHRPKTLEAWTLRFEEVLNEAKT